MQVEGANHDHGNTHWFGFGLQLCGASFNITPRNPIPTTSALTQETSAWLSLSHQTSEVSIGFRHNKSRTQSFHLTLRRCVKLSGLSCTDHAWCEVYFCPLAAEENDGEVPRSMMPMPGKHVCSDQNRKTFRNGMERLLR